MLEEHGVSMSFKDDQMIFKQGDKGEHMYVIRSGKVKIFRQSGSQRVTLATLAAGGFFGEMALFSDQPRSASAQAVGPTDLVSVDKATFMSFIKDPVVWNVLEAMTERIRDIDEQLESLVVKEQLRREYVSSMLAHRRPLV